ncbi:MAG: SRPBCC family protein [Chloroflexota bacterium]|nr:SRPBCC family protein [Chloroflexota bacterium]
MKIGTAIKYKIKLQGIPIIWQSIITDWDPPNRFCDVQRKDPYRRWIHEHIFETSGSETLVTDRVNYAVRGRKLINQLFVKKDLDRNFNYRKTMLVSMFNGNPINL